MPGFEKIRKILLYPGTEPEVRNMLEMHYSLTQLQASVLPSENVLNIFFFFFAPQAVKLLCYLFDVLSPDSHHTIVPK